MIIHVLGLGPSLKEYNPDGNKTIGCNDIWNFVQTDYVVCVDKPIAWDSAPERMQAIIAGRQERFITHLPQWKPIVHNYYEITLADHRGDLSQLDTHVPYSNNSAFVACVMAYKFGAKKIITHGVDFHGHHKLGQERIMKHCIKDFRALQVALFDRGVELRCSSRVSALAEHIGTI